MKNVKEFLIEVNKAKGYGIEDGDLIEMLRRPRVIYRENTCSHRWWESWLYVVKIEDKFIGYEWAEANRDESIFDLGWEFEWNTVAEYEPKEITTTIYVEKAD